MSYASKYPTFDSSLGMGIQVAEKYKRMFIKELHFPRNLPFHQSSILCYSTSSNPSSSFPLTHSQKRAPLPRTEEYAAPTAAAVYGKNTQLQLQLKEAMKSLLKEGFELLL